MSPARRAASNVIFDPREHKLEQVEPAMHVSDGISARSGWPPRRGVAITCF